MELIRRYGVWRTINLFWNWLLTKLTFRQALLIRFPCDIRNNKFIRVGKGFATGRYCRIEAYPLPQQKEHLLYSETMFRTMIRYISLAALAFISVIMC